MSESERRLLMAGTLDTSGVGGGEHESLQNVAMAFKHGSYIDGCVVLDMGDGEPVAIPVEELLVPGTQEAEAGGPVLSGFVGEEKAKEMEAAANASAVQEAEQKTESAAPAAPAQPRKRQARKTTAPKE
ncbi:hypothetical protein [Streptomyces sp. NPDC088752]|uniref:hypothetical protein n=1 Tax=Streptomyces sp. NPDC088752 TaxID=3154963 RepID=UPI00343BEE5F